MRDEYQRAEGTRLCGCERGHYPIPGGGARSYLAGPLQAQQETLSHRRDLLADGLVAVLLRLVPVSHDPCIWHHGGQHVPVSQPVDKAVLVATNIDLLAPRLIRMRADAVDCHDTMARLLATEQSLGEGLWTRTPPRMLDRRLGRP